MVDKRDLKEKEPGRLRKSVSQFFNKVFKREKKEVAEKKERNGSGLFASLVGWFKDTKQAIEDKSKKVQQDIGAINSETNPEIKPIEGETKKVFGQEVPKTTLDVEIENNKVTRQSRKTARQENRESAREELKASIKHFGKFVKISGAKTLKFGGKVIKKGAKVVAKGAVVGAVGYGTYTLGAAAIAHPGVAATGVGLALAARKIKKIRKYRKENKKYIDENKALKKVRKASKEFKNDKAELANDSINTLSRLGYVNKENVKEVEQYVAKKVLIVETNTKNVENVKKASAYMLGDNTSSLGNVYSDKTLVINSNAPQKVKEEAVMGKALEAAIKKEVVSGESKGFMKSGFSVAEFKEDAKGNIEILKHDYKALDDTAKKVYAEYLVAAKDPNVSIESFMDKLAAKKPVDEKVAYALFSKNIAGHQTLFDVFMNSKSELLTNSFVGMGMSAEEISKSFESLEGVRGFYDKVRRIRRSEVA